MPETLQAIVFSSTVVIGIFIFIDYVNTSPTRAFKFNAIIFYGLCALCSLVLFYFFCDYWKLAAAIILSTVCALDIVEFRRMPKTKK